MNRRERTEILINGSRLVAEKLAAAVAEKYDITILADPQEALVMVKMRETAKKSLFYLGEVLVTETKVQLNLHTGIGIVAGHDKELSYWLAIIDAAYRAEIREMGEWESILLEEKENIMLERKRKHSEILKTKVNFEMMDL